MPLHDELARLTALHGTPAILDALAAIERIAAGRCYARAEMAGGSDHIAAAAVLRAAARQICTCTPVVSSSTSDIEASGAEQTRAQELEAARMARCRAAGRKGGRARQQRLRAARARD